MKVKMNKVITILLAFMMVLSLGLLAAGCSSQNSAPGGTADTAPKASETPKAATPAASSVEGTITIAGSTSVQPLSEILAADFKKKNPKADIKVTGGGSGVGIKSVQDKTADIGASSRELKKEEQGPKEFTIAIDGIAVIVNPSNKVQSLTMEQIAKIYAGEITNWKDVGGTDGKISVYNREEGSGTRGAFEEIVLAPAKLKYTTNALIQNSTGGIKQSVAGDPKGIGYASLGIVEADKTVRMLKVNDVAPSLATIKDKSYKIWRPFLYLTKEDPQGVTKAFIDWVLSKEGQAHVIEDGYISPLDIK